MHSCRLADSKTKFNSKEIAEKLESDSLVLNKTVRTASGDARRVCYGAVFSLTLCHLRELFRHPESRVPHL